MKLLLLAGGVYHVAFAVFHLGFWKLFNWHEQLPRLGFINRNIMQILNLCLTFVFLAFAWISFTHADALPASGPGRTLLAIISMFWLLRAVEQVVFFGIRNMASAGLFAVFLSGSALYAAPLILTS